MHLLKTKRILYDVLVIFTCNGSNKFPRVVASPVLVQRAVGYQMRNCLDEKTLLQSEVT